MTRCLDVTQTQAYKKTKPISVFLSTKEKIDMTKTKPDKILIICSVAFGLFFVGVHQAGAIPTLQLYLPDGEYTEAREILGVQVEQSWMTLNAPFELMVAGAPNPNGVDVITDVALWIAIQEQDFFNNPSGLITVTDSTGNTINPSSEPVYGKPDPLSPHRIYDAYYYKYRLPDLEAGSAGESVYNYDARIMIRTIRAYPNQATSGYTISTIMGFSGCTWI